MRRGVEHVTCLASHSGLRKAQTRPRAQFLWSVSHSQITQKKDIHLDVLSCYLRARDGDRTRDPLLGKEVLHR